jgi:hypothetical protein
MHLKIQTTKETAKVNNWIYSAHSLLATTAMPAQTTLAAHVKPAEEGTHRPSRSRDKQVNNEEAIYSTQCNAN